MKNSPGSNEILPRPLPPVTELLIPTFPGTEPEGTTSHIGNVSLSPPLFFSSSTSFLLDTLYNISILLCSSLSLRRTVLCFGTSGIPRSEMCS